MKSFIFALFAVACQASYASFELVMVADRGTGSVHRFDGITGAYMGSFGAGLMNNIQHMALDQVNSKVYVLENNGFAVSSWNYNTGQYLNSWALSSAYSRIGAFTDNTFALMKSNEITRYDSFLNLLGLWNPPTDFEFRSVADNVQYGSHAFLARKTDLSDARTFQPYGSFTLGGFFWVTGGGLSVEHVDVSGQNLVYGLNSPYYIVQNKGTGSVGLGVNDLKTNLGVSQGHANMGYAIGEDSLNPGYQVVQRFDTRTYTNRGKFGYGFISNPVGISTVVAPEPGTLVALGAGLASIVRRRRAR